MNKKLLKAISLSAASIMLAGAMAGCGPKVTENGTKEEGKLIMGTNAAFPPFEFVVSQNGLVDQFDGIDVAIAKKIAEAGEQQLEIVDQEFDGLVAAVSTGKIDMAVAGMTANDERREAVDFSEPYFTATQVMVVSADNTSITKAADLSDKKVGVVLGYTGDSIVTEELQLPDANITRGSGGVELVLDVKGGKLDAVVIDSYTGKALAEKNGLKVVEDPEAFESEEYAIAVKKGNKALLDRVNEVLGEMKESGEIEQLAEKYNTMEIK